MRIPQTKTVLIVIGLILFVLACGLPAPQATEAPIVAPATSEIPIEATSLPATVPAIEVAIEHKIIPVNLPVDRSNKAGDFNSSTTAAKKIVTGGDRFTFGRFERPFNANTMDVYFSQLDIIDTYVYQDETWIYGTMTLDKPDPANGFNGKYALELDLDRDGKGDWLILASNPATTEWTVEGVQIYYDKNKDVGNKTPMFTDEKSTGDGFETLVFDQGTGEDTDSAWVRISPNDPNTVELAVNRSVLGNPEKYLINMWAGTSLLDPVLFDINDHFTHTQAGAADPGLEIYYPIKGVSELDNSCKMAVGFQPTGQEPGLCEVFVPHEPGQPQPQPGQPQQPDPFCGCSCIPC